MTFFLKPIFVKFFSKSAPKSKMAKKRAFEIGALFLKKPPKKTAKKYVIRSFSEVFFLGDAI